MPDLVRRTLPNASSEATAGAVTIPIKHAALFDDLSARASIADP
jgi:hypothetical protein